MQNVIALLVAGAAIFQLPSSIPLVTRSDPVFVRAVIDGDTLDVARVGRVRLLGIDAPEMGRGFDTTAPFAREARDLLSSLVLRHWVRLENDQKGDALDVYNRHLAYVVRDDGLVVNTEIVREGLARVTARAPLVRLGELKAAEAQAQSLRKGIWGSIPRIPTPRYTRPSP